MCHDYHTRYVVLRLRVFVLRLLKDNRSGLLEVLNLGLDKKIYLEIKQDNL